MSGKLCFQLGLGLFLLFALPLFSQGTEEDMLFQDIPTVYAAGKIEQTVDQAAATVYVVTDKEIKERCYSTIADVLRDIPGFYVSYDGIEHYIGARGFSIPGDYNSRLLFLVDGISINDELYGQGFLDNTLDLSVVKRIEVIKGPGSALYGSYAMLGVINVVTKEPEKKDNLTLNAEAGAYNVGKGSFNSSLNWGPDIQTLFAVNYFSHGGKEFYYAEYDNPAENNGIVSFGDRRTTGSVFFKLFSGNMTFTNIYSDRRLLITTGQFSTVFNDPSSYFFEVKNVFSVNHKLSLDKDKILLTSLSYHLYKFIGHYIVSIPDGAGGTYPEDNLDDQIDQNLVFSSQFTLSEKVNVFVAGLEAKYGFDEKQVNLDMGLTDAALYNIYFSDSRVVYSASAYFQNIYKGMDKLELTLGGRYDYYSSFGGFLSPRMAVVFNPAEQTVIKALYGTAFRTPNLYELYYGTTDYIYLQNPFLRPEELTTYELTVTQKMGKQLGLSVGMYQNNIKKIITQLPTGALTTAGDTIVQFVNNSEASSLGVEAGIDFKNELFSLSCGVNWQKTVDYATGDALPNSPENTGNIMLSVPVIKEKATVTFGSNFLGRRMTVKSLEWLPSCVISNLSLTVNSLVPGLDIGLKVNNIFDESYTIPVDSTFRQDTMMQDRRTLTVKAGYKF